MRALITGIDGFLGGHLAAKLVGINVYVAGVIRKEKAVSTMKILGVDKKVDLTRGTVTDLEFLEDAIADFEIDTVCHLAAIARVSVAERAPYACFESNVKGTYTVLEACRRCDVETVIVASTDKVVMGKSPVTEDMPVGGNVPYAASKACTDLIARSYHKTYGLNVCVTRCCNLYGPADLNFSRLIPSKIRDALRGVQPTLYAGREHTVQEYIYIEDAADAYAFLAEKGAVGPYHIGSGYTASAYEILNKILKTLGKEEVRIRSVEKTFKEPQGLWLDCTKIRELGWTPKVSLDEGLKMTVEWYKNYLGGK